MNKKKENTQKTETSKAEIKTKEVNIKKGSGQTGITDPVASITKDQLIKIAKEKLPDLNTSDTEAASKIIAGTAKSMGIEVK